MAEDMGVTDASQAPAESSSESGPDYSALISRMDEMTNRFQNQFSEFEQRFQQPEPEYDEDEPELDPDDPEYDEQQAVLAFQNAVKQQVDAALQPMQAEQALRDRDSALGHLEEQFPRLGEQSPAGEKFRSEIVSEALAFADSLNLDPQAVQGTPSFAKLVELAYNTRVAREASEREKPAESRQFVNLESGSGAAQSADGEDLQTGLMKRLGLNA
jgi:hypothetical protein